MRLFFNCCFLAEPLQCGIPLGTGRPGAPSRPIPQQYSVFPLFHERNLAKQAPFFPSSFCRAQLFSEPSAPLPNPIAVRSSQAGAGGSAARDGHPGLEQPIFVWKCTVVQCYQCNFDLQCWHVSGSCVWLVFSVSGRLQNFGPTHWKNKKKKNTHKNRRKKQEIINFSCISVYVFFLQYTVHCWNVLLSITLYSFRSLGLWSVKKEQPCLKEDHKWRTQNWW